MQIGGNMDAKLQADSERANRDRGAEQFMTQGLGMAGNLLQGVLGNIPIVGKLLGGGGGKNK